MSKTFFIVHEPGKIPRVGFPLDDPARLDDAVRNWQDANPTATVYVVQCPNDVPCPGSTWVTTAREWIQAIEADRDAHG